MDETVDNQLLSSVPVGDELHDPREGSHELRITEAEAKLFEASGTYGIAIKFSGGKDSEGNLFDFTHTIFLPTREKSDGFKRMFLASLHDLGLVARDDHRERYITGETDVAAYVAAVKQLAGTVYPVRLTPDKEGRLQLKFIRTRK